MSTLNNKNKSQSKCVKSSEFDSVSPEQFQHEMTMVYLMLKGEFSKDKVTSILKKCNITCDDPLLDCSLSDMVPLKDIDFSKCVCKLYRVSPSDSTTDLNLPQDIANISVYHVKLQKDRSLSFIPDNVLIVSGTKSINVSDVAHQIEFNTDLDKINISCISVKSKIPSQISAIKIAQLGNIPNVNVYDHNEELKNDNDMITVNISNVSLQKVKNSKLPPVRRLKLYGGCEVNTQYTFATPKHIINPISMDIGAVVVNDAVTPISPITVSPIAVNRNIDVKDNIPMITCCSKPLIIGLHKVSLPNDTAYQLSPISAKKVSSNIGVVLSHNVVDLHSEVITHKMVINNIYLPKNDYAELDTEKSVKIVAPLTFHLYFDRKKLSISDYSVDRILADKKVSVELKRAELYRVKNLKLSAETKPYIRNIPNINVNDIINELDNSVKEFTIAINNVNPSDDIKLQMKCNQIDSVGIIDSPNVMMIWDLIGGMQAIAEDLK